MRTLVLAALTAVLCGGEQSLIAGPISGRRPDPTAARLLAPPDLAPASASTEAVTPLDPIQVRIPAAESFDPAAGIVDAPPVGPPSSRVAEIDVAPPGPAEPFQYLAPTEVGVPSHIPEPASILLLATGIVGLLARRELLRRRNLG